MKAHTERHESTNVSRRSFFRLTVGSISLLPTVASALALAPQVALAAEDEKRAGLAANATIYVVSPRELGLVVRDVTIEDGTANLIKDAHVRIISRYNGRELDGYTDDKGTVHFDIADLAEDQGKKEQIPRYAFNATIEVSAPGYREFRTNLIRVDGGTALGIPTQPRESGLPYPKCTSFDGWDVLYSSGDDSTFLSSTGNDAKHTIALTLRDCPAGASVTAGIFANGERQAKTTVKADADGTAQVELKDCFLLAGDVAALPAGEDCDYSMRYIVDGTTYEVPIKLAVTEAAPEAQKSQTEKDLELVPFNDTSMFTAISVPESWPVIGGAKFKMWQPSFFFNATYDPFGYLMIKFTTPEVGYKADNGGKNDNGWQVMPRKWPNQAYKQSLSDMVDQVGKVFSSFDGENFWRQTSFAHKFSFTVQAELMAAAQWEFSKKESRGRAAAALNIAANYSFTEQFWAGPFPMFIRFGVLASAKLAAEMGFISPSIWKFSQYRWDYTSCGFDMQLCAAPSLSVGVGIAGVSSISLKGAFSITYCLHEGPLPAGYENLPSPHTRWAIYAAATVEAELLWFTKVWKLWELNEPHWIDNWEKSLSAKEAPASELQGKSLQDALGESEIITAQSLESLAEFATSGLEGMNPQEKKLTGYTLFERTPEGDRPVAKMYLAKERAHAFASGSGVKLESAVAGDGDAIVQTDGQDLSLESDAAQDAVKDVTTAAEDIAETGAEPAAVAAATALVAGAADDGIEIVGEEAAAASQFEVTTPQVEESAADAGALTAQDSGSEPSFILRPTNDEIVAFETGPTDAQPIGEHNYVEVGNDAPGVLRLGLEQGFRPTTDIRLAENILLPQRQKLFTVGDADYIARIGAVVVAGQVRTRIICSQVNGADRRVLDFVSAYGRNDCFDYDFDIGVARVDGRDVVDLVVISGERPEGDATKLVQAATKTYFSFVSCTDWNAGTFTGVTVIARAMDTIGDRCQHYPYRNYSNPRLVHIKDTKDGKEYCKAAVAYLERASVREDQIMGTNPKLTVAGVGVVFFANGDDTINVDSLDVMRPFNNRVLADPTITEVALSGRADGYQMLEIKGGQNTYYTLLETDPCWYVFKDGTSLARLHSARMVDLGAYAGKLTRLIPMESGAYFLTCADGMLKRVDVNPGSDSVAPTLEYSDFGGSELNMDDFGVLENGDVLYWPAARTSGGYQFDPASPDEPQLLEGEEGELNLIMGACVRNGKLSKAFALSEVGHPITQIRTFGNSDDHMSFISANNVDLGSGKGELWYTEVPWVRCANLLDAKPYDTLVARGDKLPFYVTLRNDGNCYLSGVELTVAEVGGAAIGTIRLDFGEGNLIPSEWNPRNAEGNIENVEDDWALAPGTTSRYLASSVTIPDNWEGEKEIEIFVSAAYGTTVRFADGLRATAEQHSIEYLPDQRITTGLKLGGSELKIEEQGSFGAADVSVVKGRGKSLGKAGSKASGKTGGTKAASKAAGKQSSAKASGSASATSGAAQATGSNGSKAAAPATAATTATGAPASLPKTGDDLDAYKRGSLPKTGDPANVAAAAAVAAGGVASLVAADYLRSRKTNEE